MSVLRAFTSRMLKNITFSNLKHYFIYLTPHFIIHSISKVLLFFTTLLKYYLFIIFNSFLSSPPTQCHHPSHHKLTTSDLKPLTQPTSTHRPQPTAQPTMTQPLISLSHPFLNLNPCHTNHRTHHCYPTT